MNTHSYHSRIRSLVLAAGAGCLAMSGQGELPVAKLASQYVRPAVLPTNAREYLLATGKRLEKPGKEAFIFNGTFTDDQGTGTARVTWQLPGMLRFERQGAVKKVFMLDPQSAAHGAGSLSDQDQDVLEALTYDRPEAFFYALQQGLPYRFLGGGFRQAGAAPGTGPYYDIYEVYLPIKFRAGAPVKRKLYYFDSLTKLLGKVQTWVNDTDQTGVSETTISNWTTLNTLSAPGTVVLTRKGTVVFTFSQVSALPSAALGTGAFSSLEPLLP